MISIFGIESNSFGGICTIRGYAKYTDIVENSFADENYQRPIDDKHVEEIKEFISSGENCFSPEVVLSYKAEYDYYASGASSDVDAVSDILTGKGFASNKNGVVFKKNKKIGDGYLYEIQIPTGENVQPVFKRIDGNHRLMAFKKLIDSQQITSAYLIPFCIIVFRDDETIKSEKTIFHNINSKAVPLKSEELLRGIIITNGTNSNLDFSDKELKEKFGMEYFLVRQMIVERPTLTRKIKSIPWAKYNLITTIVDLYYYVEQYNKCTFDSVDAKERLFNAINNAVEHATEKDENTLIISSGILFLLAAINYDIETKSGDKKQNTVRYRNNLINWVNKYNITDVLHDDESSAAVNADCIKEIFEKYIVSADQTIFLSRCFASEYDENERAIRRVIDAINDEKGVQLKLLRVDKHSEGHSAQISDRIFKYMKKSGLIIADLSGGKPNIPHEIGYAMGLGKDIIIIHNGTDKEADEHTPSNIKMFEQIRFNRNYQKLEEELKNDLINYYKL